MICVSYGAPDCSQIGRIVPWRGYRAGRPRPERDAGARWIPSSPRAQEIMEDPRPHINRHLPPPAAMGLPGVHSGVVRCRRRAAEASVRSLEERLMRARNDAAGPIDVNGLLVRMDDGRAAPAVHHTDVERSRGQRFWLAGGWRRRSAVEG